VTQQRQILHSTDSFGRRRGALTKHSHWFLNCKRNKASDDLAGPVREHRTALSEPAGPAIAAMR
jgi:hypothetical protein